MQYQEAVAQFLEADPIAVAGVSSSDPNAPANLIFRKLRQGGHQVFAINPKTEKVEGADSYPDLAALPQKPQAVMIAGPAAASVGLIEQCAELGIALAWIHSSMGEGSYSEEAVQLAKEKGITLIPTGCPMMFAKPVDLAHKCFRAIFQWTGKIPKEVG